MNDRSSDALLMVSVVVAGAWAGCLWLGARLAAMLSGHSFGGSPAKGLFATVGLVQDPSRPWMAWGYERSTFAPLWLYWLCTALLLILGGYCGFRVLVWWVRDRVEFERDDRLGVRPDAHIATADEIRPLLVDKPVQGRFSFGRYGDKILATEDPATQSARQIRNRAKTRVGDRTAVMIFGLTRSGKSATVTPGILEWDNPAIISSVKADVMMATVKRRLQLGEVFVFDPFGVAPAVPGVQQVSWSPVSTSHTISGAIASAQTLADAAASDDVTAAGYWADRGAAILWPLLYAAAIDGRSMGDVLRWLALQDGTDPNHSEVRTILTTAIRSGGADGLQAQKAWTTFDGWTKLDPRPRSDQNSTAQSLVSCWADPFASAASDPALPPIDIERVLRGRNTLYIVQPLGHGDRFSPLFGGLFGDLIRDQCYRVAQAAGRRIGPLLAVLDEAGNTPLRWLPEVASTCAGIGVQLVTIWQERNQIDTLYQKAGQSLLNNHGTKIFFAGQTDRSTLEYASMLCGEEEIVSRASSADMHFGSVRRTANASPTSKRLVPPDIIRQMPNGTALLIHSTLPPVHMVGRRLPEEPDLQSAAEGRGPTPPPLDLDPAVQAALPAARMALPDRVVDHLAATETAAPARSPLDPPQDSDTSGAQEVIAAWLASQQANQGQ